MTNIIEFVRPDVEPAPRPRDPDIVIIVRHEHPAIPPVAEPDDPTGAMWVAGLTLLCGLVVAGLVLAWSLWMLA